MPLAPGTRLGPYEILAPLGAGGMGEVLDPRGIRQDPGSLSRILAGTFGRAPGAPRPA